MDANDALKIGAFLLNEHPIACSCLTMLQMMWISPLEAAHRMDGAKDSVSSAILPRNPCHRRSKVTRSVDGIG